MITAYNTFQDDITRIKGLFAVYNHLKDVLHLSEDVTSEILRNQYMYAVSAMDKFMHEIVRVGFIESYRNLRPQTQKFINMPLPISVTERLIQCSNPTYVPTSISETIDNILSEEISRQTRTVAYQHPDKIKDGLSIVWNEEHKFQKLATSMGRTMPNNDKILSQELILITDRRNQIVHQSDMLPGQYTKQSISRENVEKAIDTLSKFCKAVYDEVHI